MALADEIEQIRQEALKRGIDFNTALRVFKHEGLQPGVYQSNVYKNGMREPSYGPGQMLVGGPGTGFPTGMGNDFMAATGLDPRDPSTVPRQIPFLLDQALKKGWSPWYGAKAAGVGQWEGLPGGPVNVTPASDTNPNVDLSGGPMNLQDYLDQLHKQDSAASDVGPLGKLLGVKGGSNLGSKITMLGGILSGLAQGHGPDANMIAAIQDQREQDRKYSELNRQREMAMKYAVKSGNQTLADALLSGMDPSEVVKLGYTAEYDTKKRQQDLADYEKEQQLQAQYDPTAAREREKQAAYAKYAETLFGPLDTTVAGGQPAGTGGSRDVGTGNGTITATPITPPSPTNVSTKQDRTAYSPREDRQTLLTPVSTKDQSRIDFNQTSTGQQPTQQQSQELPTVSKATEQFRKKFNVPWFTDADLESMRQETLAKGPGGFFDALSKMRELHYKELELQKPTGYGPNTQVRDPSGKLLFTTPPSPDQMTQSYAPNTSVYDNEGKFLFRTPPAPQGQKDYPPNTSVYDANNNFLFKTPPAPETVPADYKTAELLKNHPELMDTYLKMKQAASGTPNPEDTIYAEMAKATVSPGGLYDKIQDRGNELANSAPQIKALEELMSVAPQGMTMEAYLAKYFPGVNSAADAIKAVVSSMAPRERVVGTGSTSDLEYKGMLAVFPSLLNTPEGNKALLAIYKAKRNIEIERADIVSRYKSGDITFKESQRQMKELNKKSILADVPKEVRDVIEQGQNQVKSEENAASGNIPPISEKAKKNNFTEEDWKTMTDEERKQWSD